MFGYKGLTLTGRLQKGHEKQEKSKQVKTIVIAYNEAQ